MASRDTACLHKAMVALNLAAFKPQTRSLPRLWIRSMATATPTNAQTRQADSMQSLLQSWRPASTVPVTIHSFPSFEPISLERWSVDHLYLPLRRDLLHLAIVYEGDNTRQGTASSKNRWEVHGSHRKLRPQKGTGQARLGSRQSPMLVGGGKTFGPHPRDFGTKLNRKVYDKAWRTALSYRYRRGELMICQDGMELAMPSDFELAAKEHLKDGLRESYLEKYVKGVLLSLGLGRTGGRTLFVTTDRRPWLSEAMDLAPREGRALVLPDVDVKDLLETGKVVMERSVLQEMLAQHQSDLVSKIVINGIASKGPPMGEQILGPQEISPANDCSRAIT